MLPAMTTAKDPIRPFRWNLAHREQLGRLVDGEAVEAYPDYAAELRRAAALILARARPGTLVFVGRSPENLFDYLSGVFSGIDGAPDLQLLQVSLRNAATLDTIAASQPNEFAALCGYFDSERLDPASILAAAGDTTFIDIVSSGATFGALAHLLRIMSERAHIDWQQVARRIAFVGLLEATKNSPNTWRWWQRQSWVAELPHARISNVSIPYRMWIHMADTLDKVTPSHTSWRWADPRTTLPSRYEPHLRALRMALQFYESGLSGEERRTLSNEIAKLREMRDGHVRRLVTRLRAAGGQDAP